MTIALIVKVNDGVVLAADSATTMMSSVPDGASQVLNIYNNANKLFNLHKGLPIGAMTWGLGNIGPYSIASLAKDIRRAFHGEDKNRDWGIKPGVDYEMRTVVEKVNEYMWDDRYLPEFGDPAAASDAFPTVLGFLVAGYSSDSDEPKIYAMNYGAPGGQEPIEILAGTTGAQWWGQPEAIARIVNGLSLDVVDALGALGVPKEDRFGVFEVLGSQVQTQIVSPAMPIQDAIDLAEFLVYSTIQFVRFSPGNPTVGGPIEVATITKHEGFKWVRRKHYFSSDLNPRMEMER